MTHSKVVDVKFGCQRKGQRTKGWDRLVGYHRFLKGILCDVTTSPINRLQHYSLLTEETMNDDR